MAKKKLKGIVWPNIPNDVYYLDADKVEYDDTETYSEGSVGDALQNKANIDGSYENLTAGNAEQIVTKIRANDQTPYLFRTSGGSVDIGDREYINGIVGGTVAWNQLVDIYTTSRSKTENGVTITDNRDGSYTVSTDANGATANTYIALSPMDIIQGHKYFWASTPNNAPAGCQSYITGNITGLNDYGTGRIWLGSGSGTGYVVPIYIPTGVVIASPIVFVPQCFDLTLMFGSTIADYIYSLEQATAGAGVAFFKSLFPKPYYAYNAGELMSVSGLVSHDMVGFNAWDEEWEVGGIDAVSGANGSASAIRSKGYVRCIPNTTYYVKCRYLHNSNYAGLYIKYFDADKNPISGNWDVTNVTDNTVLTATNAYYMRFMTLSGYGTTYNHDICINLSWDGSEDGNYEPYQKWSYPLDSDLELRGIPKLDASNNLYYDGDVYEPDGTVTRKYGIVDLGSRSWTADGANGLFISVGFTGAKYIGNLICPKYIGIKTDTSSLSDKTMVVGNSQAYPILRIMDTAYAGQTGSAFKTAMSGVYLVYELATPTTESADPYTSPQIVNDFGTEEWVLDSDVFPMPVGHNTDYPINLKAKVEMMPNSPDGDGDYIVRQTNGTNEYVSIANNSTISGLVSRSPVASGADGTYVLKATISGGTVTYSWEAE